MDDWEELKEKYDRKENRTRKLWYIVSAIVAVSVISAVFFMTDYLEIGGLQQTGPASLEVIDATCNFVRGEYYLSVRNQNESEAADTEGITVVLDDVTISSSMSWDKTSIKPGDFATATLSGHNIESGEVHVIKVTGPDGRTRTANAIC